ncbi:MAG: ribose 5-phosphate isomerase B [Armatimonadetes bacterium]|nr:ribose 5-phosphate isomerase B [Armatimonadota bacterium]
MKIAFGCDHGGWPLRDTIIQALRDSRHEVLDLGPESPESSDYPDYANAVARAVVEGKADLGVLACGTGIGMAISANKVPGAYAANVSDTYSARMAREHNGANILTLGGRTLGTEVAREVLQAFVESEVSPLVRHQRRRKKIKGVEQANAQ